MIVNSEPKTDKKNSIEYRKIVGSIAGIMKQQGALSSGEMAELRRISQDQPFTPALWRLLIMLNLTEPPSWISQNEWERRWAPLFMGMAHCNGLHNFNISLGEGLANAGWSELRFVQLMRAKGENLEIQLRRLAQFLSSKNQETNWTDVARLLFHQSGSYSESIRLSISRNYYTKIYSNEKSNR